MRLRTSRSWKGKDTGCATKVAGGRELDGGGSIHWVGSGGRGRYVGRSQPADQACLEFAWIAGIWSGVIAGSFIVSLAKGRAHWRAILGGGVSAVYRKLFI